MTRQGPNSPCMADKASSVPLGWIVTVETPLLSGGGAALEICYAAYPDPFTAVMAVKAFVDASFETPLYALSLGRLVCSYSRRSILPAVRSSACLAKRW